MLKSRSYFWEKKNILKSKINFCIRVCNRNGYNHGMIVLVSQFFIKGFYFHPKIHFHYKKNNKMAEPVALDLCGLRDLEVERRPHNHKVPSSIPGSGGQFWDFISPHVLREY